MSMLCFLNRYSQESSTEPTIHNNIDLRISEIQVSNEMITAQLMDGRSISVPLAWSWRLSEATSEQRANYQLIGDGEGIHWPDIDEDISVEGMLYGAPAPRRGDFASTD